MFSLRNLIRDTPAVCSLSFSLESLDQGQAFACRQHVAVSPHFSKELQLEIEFWSRNFGIAFGNRILEFLESKNFGIDNLRIEHFGIEFRNRFLEKADCKSIIDSGARHLR